MILPYLRRHATLAGTMAALTVHTFLLPDDWGWWIKMPIAVAVGIGLSTLLSRTPAKRY